MGKYTDKERLEDFRYFVDHYDEFFRQYGACFVVIRLKEIIGVYGSLPEAYEEARTQNLVGACIIQECNGDESAYTDYCHRPVKFEGLKEGEYSLMERSEKRDVFLAGQEKYTKRPPEGLCHRHRRRHLPDSSQNI